jgi:hypothetical protein
MPAEAGIHDTSGSGVESCLDPRLRGDDDAAAGCMVGTSLGRKLVEFAGLGVALDPVIEQARLELLEPIAQFGDVLRRKPSNSRYYVLKPGHDLMLSALWPNRDLETGTAQLGVKVASMDSIPFRSAGFCVSMPSASHGATCRQVYRDRRRHRHS